LWSLQIAEEVRKKIKKLIDKGHRNKSFKKIEIFTHIRKVTVIKNTSDKRYLNPKRSEKKDLLIAKIASTIAQGHHLSIQKLASLYR